MKLLIKEWKLCMHPAAYFMLLCAALILVPGYPYGVTCFYMALAIFFICLSARENHDASFTLMLPVSRADAVRGRILFCALLEAADLLLIILFILLKNALGSMRNPAGLDAGLALVGECLILYTLFDLIFFPVYYKDINKPGKAFVLASSAMFLWIVLEVIGTYAIPFFRDVLDQPDPQYLSDKALFTFGALALFIAGNAWNIRICTGRFEAQDLNL